MTAHAVAASSDAAGFQPDEGGSQPTLLLQLAAEDFTAAQYVIRPVNTTTATHWYERWHYLHKPGTGTHWGLFAPDLLAVVSIGNPNNDHGVAERFGLGGIPGNVEINRVAVHPASPTHTSRLIRLVLRRAVPDLDWVFSYADPGAGHHGGIYQALGATYVGLSLQAPASFVIGGEVVHPRSVVKRFGTMGVTALRDLGVAFDRTERPEPKHTYILPLRHRAAIRDVLASHSKPYPKRAVA